MTSQRGIPYCTSCMNRCPYVVTETRHLYDGNVLRATLQDRSDISNRAASSCNNLTDHPSLHQVWVLQIKTDTTRDASFVCISTIIRDVISNERIHAFDVDLRFENQHVQLRRQILPQLACYQLRPRYNKTALRCYPLNE